ncbi:MAG TPA: hypothetical protein PLJ47_10380 [Candidatus Hydrogenedentes bacterium]|nr:hypothetical protein [Candidatus Hydrogenedentota bacterium]HRK34989.1 hypothetical protein [Candidatus Hydrogenedentota bacterium]
MRQHFSDPDRAIAYVCAEIRKHSPDGWVMLTFYPRGHHHPRSKVVPMRLLTQTLEQMCGRFYESTALCGLEVDGLCFGGVQCHCPRNGMCRCAGHRLHHWERPMVSMVLLKNEDTRVSDSDQAQIHDLLVEASYGDARHSRHDSHSSHGNLSPSRR